MSALLRLTGSASSWADELLGGLVVDASRMTANLAATKGCRWLSMSPRCSPGCSAAPGTRPGGRGERAGGGRGLPLRDVLLAVPELEDRLAAGITAEQIESALEPAGYLGAAGCLHHRGPGGAPIMEVRHG